MNRLAFQILLGLSAWTVTGAQAQLPLDFELVNRTPFSAPIQSNGDSEVGDVSADGRFALLVSAASNLVPDDTNHASDVFRFDRLEGTLLRISTAPGGIEANGPAAGAAAMSADGQQMVYSSRASNLLPGDSDTLADLYLRSLPGPALELLTGGVAGEALDPDLSADARYVVYTHAPPGGGTRQIQLLDRNSGSTTLVSRSPSGEPGNGDAIRASISGDGRWVLFSSLADNLGVVADSNGQADVFLFDRDTQVVQRLSVVSGGATDNGRPSELAAGPASEALSADGSLAVFSSTAGLLPADTDGDGADVYVFQRNGGVLSLLNPGQIEGFAVISASSPALSADGSQVLYAALLQRGDGSRFRASIVQTLAGGATRIVSRRSDGSIGDGEGGAMSADGQVVFYSDRLDPEPADQNTFRDLRYVLMPGQPGVPVSFALGGNSANAPNHHSLPVDLSDEGRWVSFESRADNHLVDGLPIPAVYLRDRFSSVTRRVSQTAAGEPFLCPAVGGQFNASADLTLFTACTQPLDTDNPGVTQVWRYERATGFRIIVSTNALGEPGAGGDSIEGRISSNGRVISWVSNAPNLTGASGDPTPRLVLRNLDFPQQRGVFPPPAIIPDCATDFRDQRMARDGRTLVFVSCASNLGVGGLPAGQHLYALDTASLSLSLVSPAMAAPGTRYTLRGLSADGRFVLADETGPGFAARTRVLLMDRALGGIRQLDAALFNQPNLSLVEGGESALSPDARYVLLPVRSRYPAGASVLNLVDLLDGSQVLLDNRLGVPFNDTLFRPILAFARARMVFASSADNLSSQEGNGRFIDIGYIENLAPPQPQQLLRNGFEY